MLEESVRIDSIKEEGMKGGEGRNQDTGVRTEKRDEALPPCGHIAALLPVHQAY